jgi:hypothetical protein
VGEDVFGGETPTHPTTFDPAEVLDQAERRPAQRLYGSAKPAVGQTGDLPQQCGYLPANDLREAGLHHEVYLSDPRRTAPSKLRTILRQPVECNPVE